jgi:hypothetical protein
MQLGERARTHPYRLDPLSESATSTISKLVNASFKIAVTAKKIHARGVM